MKNALDDIEKIVGHAKNDGLLGKNYLKGTHGDKINTTLAATGFNLRQILRFIRILWLYFIMQIIQKITQNQIIGWTNNADDRPVLKVKIAATPEDGKANTELIKFLAKQWKVPKSSLELISGEISRHKRLKIHDEALAERVTTIHHTPPPAPDE